MQLLTLEMQNSVQFACNKVYSKVTEMRLKNDSNNNNNYYYYYYYYKHERVLRKFKTDMQNPRRIQGFAKLLRNLFSASHV